MKLNVVSIGNSKGVRIPKSILEQCEIGKSVDLKVDKKKIILFPSKEKPREGWNQAFKKMASKGEDKLLIGDTIDMDWEEWDW